MDEQVNQKKRGRPSTTKNNSVKNEQTDKITMVKGQDVPAEQKQATIDQVSKRWHEIFNRYHDTVGLNNIMSAWTASSLAINNPFIQNTRIKQINSPAIKMSKEELNQAMSDPQGNESSLRSIAWGLYYSNYIYQTLIQLNRHVPEYLFYATPLYIDNVQSGIVRDESIIVDKILKKFNPKLTLKTIATQVAIEGKCSYLVRTSYHKNEIDFLLLQKLNSNQVKLTGFGSKQQFIASFNMAIFLEPGYSVDQYPDFIKSAWQDMIDCGIVIRDPKTGRSKLNPKSKLPSGHALEISMDNKYLYWVKLPQDLCYTFYADGSNPNAFPETLGLFPDLNDLGDYRWLQGNLLAKGVSSVLTAEVPLVKDPKPGADSTAISPDTILGYEDLFSETVSANIMPFFAPFTNYELHNLENQPESMNIIYSRIRDLIATSGNSALLPMTDKPSIASTKAAEAIIASKTDYLTRQFQSFLNEVINNNYHLKNTWNIVLHGDIFSHSEQESKTKELVIQGASGLLPRLLSYEGLTMEDYLGSSQYLDALGVQVVFSQNNNQDNLDSNGEEPQEGRPPLEDDEIENDNTGISRNVGGNVSDIK